MAQNFDKEQDRMEQEFHDHLNETVKGRADKFAARMNEMLAEASAAAAKNRKRKITREVARCFLSAAAIGCLYMAETAGLISNVLTVPVYAIAFVYIGWHLCKIDRLVGRK